MSIYALFHLYIPLLLYYFIYSYCALLQVVQTPSLKYSYVTQKKKQHKSHGSNRDALPLVQCTNACKQPPHPERPVFHTLENERLFEKIADSKESIFPIRCFFVGSECVWRVFLGGFTPSSIPFYCLDFALSVCALQFGNKLERSKVRNTWQSVLPPSMKAKTKASLHSATRLDPRKSVQNWKTQSISKTYRIPCPLISYLRYISAWRSTETRETQRTQPGW